MVSERWDGLYPIIRQGKEVFVITYDQKEKTFVVHTKVEDNE